MSLLLGTACSVRQAGVLPSSALSANVVPSAASAAPALAHRTNAAGTGGDVVAFNAGGPAAGNFSADADYGSGTWSYTTGATVSTGAIANPGPASIYQSERVGSTVSYRIPGLNPGAPYTVKLSFAELYWHAAGARTFDVAINGATVLPNFDVFATAGGANTAIMRSFATTANADGTIAVVLTAHVDHASIVALEIAAGTSSTPAPAATPVPAASLYIDSGGGQIGAFAADEYFASRSSFVGKATTRTIDTSLVSNPAPQAVYQTQRAGTVVTYAIRGLGANTPYAVRLDFAETFWSSPGQRIFNASINAIPVLVNFDIVAAAGGPFKAVAETFAASSTTAGTMSIVFNRVKDNAAISGIELVPVGPGATPTPTPTPTATPTATATPTVAPTPTATATSTAIVFNDYTTFAYDNQRDAFNPNSTAFTPANLGRLHLAWQAAIGGGDYNTQTQPVLATEIPNHAGVLFVGGGSGKVDAYDALTGTLMWTQMTGQELYSCENNYTLQFGIGGTAAYDPGSKSIYIVGNQNTGVNTTATNTLFHLDGASGNVLGAVNVSPPTPGWSSLDFAHTAVTLSGGMAYVGTSATCDISSWRGRLAAVSVPAMSLAATFFPVWNGTTQPWGGGGVWGWGGAAIDTGGNPLFGVGNADTGLTTHGTIVAPFQKAPKEYSAYGDSIVQISPDLSTVLAANEPLGAFTETGNSDDLDLTGTPIVFKPRGAACDPMAAIQGKAGAIFFYDTLHLGAGPVASFQLAPSTYSDGFLGSPAYSPVTGLVYVSVPSSNQSLFPPGMVAIDPGCGRPSIVWNAGFGPDSYQPGSDTSPGLPRSVPAPSAGGVVFIGTMCTVSGSSCAATVGGNARGRVSGAAQTRKPLICCAPPGTSGGALWAVDAATGTVLNGGNPILLTSATLRVPPTIDGNWLFVMDNGGNLYGLTLDPNFASLQTKYRAPAAQQLLKSNFKR